MILEARLPPPTAAAVVLAWRAAVAALATALDWVIGVPVHVVRGGEVVLAFTAPPDALLTATEVNEWAWRHALAATGLPVPPAALSPGDVPHDAPSAVMHLRARAMLEARRPTPEVAVPVPATMRMALVTGSNGKTTTTRLLAAMAMAAGWRTGWSCTDGVMLDGHPVERGDWAGPIGAQRVTRDPSVACAILETARGGILRRGLGVLGARVAVVTNVQADHFGEYGITTLAALAAVKLVVAKGLAPGGALVLNAEDPALRAAWPTTGPRPRWFATHAPLGEDAPPLDAWQAHGVLHLRTASGVHGLGSAAAMPLSAGGTAAHNIANMLAAALAADSLGVPPDVIRAVLARFGADPADNPGRLAHYLLDGAHLLLDYAHNPAGLGALLTVAGSLAPRRLLLLLGQAGNRDDDALAALAATAHAAAPDRIILKDLDGYQRGRATGEVPARLAELLGDLGMASGDLEVVLDEAAAVAAALAWSAPGDVLVLPVHALAARDHVAAMLQERGATPAGWGAQAG